MITKEGIKMHPKKVQAVMDMKAPRTMKDVLRLNGGVATLSRLIPRCADEYQHFFKLLKFNKKTIEWSLTCKKAFEEL